MPQNKNDDAGWRKYDTFKGNFTIWYETFNEK